MKKDYYFIEDTFVIEDFDKKKTFASFLPAIAGEKGIPLWCYYVNRGQGVASFGIRDKDGGILEFSPANTSYFLADRRGFRTFIKVNNVVHEIFSISSNEERRMYVRNSEFSIEEINKELGLKILVTYFGLPNENISGLVRKVEITSFKDQKIEIVDGLTEIIPSGINEWSMKHQSNLIKSWMDVKELKEHIPYYVVNSLPGDESEVKEIESGNYYISSINGELAHIIYDGDLIFSYDQGLSKAVNFIEKSVEELKNIKQVPANKIPMGFTIGEIDLRKDETAYLNTVIGFASKKEMVEEKIEKFIDLKYIEKKQKEAKEVLTLLSNDIESSTAFPIFDNYLKQNYLDNLLRGGYPKVINAKNKKFIYYLYSRRHGDLEREYNFFSIAPEFYSQGNGAFRDVCQNRRSDSLFHKEVELYNAKVFANLIQLDGYNPLVVQGSTFLLDNIEDAEKLSQECFDNKQEVMKKVLEERFTPGTIFNTMENEKITSKYPDEEIFEKIFSVSSQEIDADFGEGYWSDHWTYLLDLIENTLKIYPEKLKEYMFMDKTYRYYDSPVTVLKRDEKYVLTKNNEVHQYGALLNKDQEKIKVLKMKEGSNWAKDAKGKIITTSLFGKLLSLSILKFSNLDSIGVGIEMEADKPGWNDPMNGLPGIFGSGVSESIELARVVSFLIDSYDKEEVSLPIEMIELLENILHVYKNNSDKFSIWDKVCAYKEEYRAKTRFGVKEMSRVDQALVIKALSLFKEVLDEGIAKAFLMGKGILPSYLVRKVIDFSPLNRIGHYGLPVVRVKAFETRAIPYFLEAPSRSLKYIKDKELLKNMYNEIKKTELFDKVLHVYKTSINLDNEGYDIGRVRAYQRGWLERESDFMHMTYKYLYGLLKAHLYEEFFSDIKTNFTCFMDPSIYGRSTLENSSFIATSNNPDKSVWGRGYISRLTGTTAELISMWQIMMFGERPFRYNKELEFKLEPVLSKDFFKEDKTVKALFLSNIMIEYINENLINTYDGKVKKYVLINDKETITINSDKISGKVALDIRDYKYSLVKVYF